MKIKVTSLDSTKATDIELNDAVFGLAPRKDILQRMVEWQRAKKRAGTHSTKNVREVHGTTKKPFKQKGTGNARQGSLKGPHMRGGGVAHGPRVHSHVYSLTKKFRQLGLKTALSTKLAEGKLQVFSDIKLKEAKTKDLDSRLNKLNLASTLFIDGDTVDDNFAKAASNLYGIDILPQQGANVLDILRHENLVLSLAAVKKLEERLA